MQHEAVAHTDGVVLIDEHGRSLGAHDVAEVVGLPVLATIEARTSTARVVDAGVLPNRVPDSVARPMRAALGTHRLFRRRASRMTPSLRDTLQQRLLAAPFDPASMERAELRAHLSDLLRDEAPLAHGEPASLMLDELVDDVGGLGPLEHLMDDPGVTEIMVNGPDRVYVERNGQVTGVSCAIDAADDRSIDRAHRRAARAADRSRLTDG